MNQKKLIKVILGLAIAFAFTILFQVFFASDCTNDIIESFSFENSANQAVLFERGCGATTTTSYNVMITSRDRPFQYQPKKVVFTCTALEDYRIYWSSKTTLHIHFNANDVFKKVEGFNGIEIIYHSTSSTHDDKPSQTQEIHDAHYRAFGDEQPSS